MPNPHYERGVRLERAAQAHLRKCGFTAWRTPGSKSLCDVIACGKGTTVGFLAFVQCKSDAKDMSKRARQSFAYFAAAHGARPLLVTGTPARMNLEWLDEEGE